MFDHPLVARGLLTLLCAAQGVATLAIDLNRNHATNPLWPGHARFHLVWQAGSTFMLAAVEVALICWSGPYAMQRFSVLWPLRWPAFLCWGSWRRSVSGGPMAALFRTPMAFRPCE